MVLQRLMVMTKLHGIDGIDGFGFGGGVPSVLQNVLERLSAGLELKKEHSASDCLGMNLNSCF